jgi:hypothetical protein
LEEIKGSRKKKKGGRGTRRRNTIQTIWKIIGVAMR